MTNHQTDETTGDPWSVTAGELHAALRGRLREGIPTVVATVVDVDGHAYRRPGARMLVGEDERAGAITAGCLEGPVADLAADVREDGRPTVRTFDLTDEEGWGLGLGCNGVIDVLLEPLDESWEPALSALTAGRPVAMVTVVTSTDPDVPVGARAVPGEHDGPWRTRASLPRDAVEALAEPVRTALERGDVQTPTVSTAGGEVTVFVEGLEPRSELLLFGNQNDVHPVARFGRQLGFSVTVASARGARADPSQFPNAHRVEAVRPTEVDDLVRDPDRTYAVLMSHNLVDDRLAMERLLRATTVPYVGLMGPRDRFEELRDAVAEEGEPFTEDELQRVATPVGLDLGGGEPVEIAFSVLAEVVAIAHGREGGRLKHRSGPIHERDASPSA